MLGKSCLYLTLTATLIHEFQLFYSISFKKCIFCGLFKPENSKPFQGLLYLVAKRAIHTSQQFKPYFCPSPSMISSPLTQPQMAADDRTFVLTSYSWISFYHWTFPGWSGFLHTYFIPMYWFWLISHLAHCAVFIPLCRHIYRCRVVQKCKKIEQ